ncbi:xanthine dehydrogenase family protein molybdopterin-binding subunit [Salinisphaera orenii]|uniref:Aldehyde oxidase n=1 Tax=Salinisphaera orenii YIM 95161 TaxID=1051139 RepID=A0A423Q5Y7_9GAMM|nr:xanthine dehydrogenase family protein molybdopterin-binding subunit [Salinisphaera halophila]ROO34936.1 aldehyde oxidase [Salinisphaera halophila YIM 95161]
MSVTTTSLSRRDFLRSAAWGSAGLVIAMALPGRGRAATMDTQAANSSLIASDAAGFAPNAFVRIAPDDTVTVLIKHIEFGQGPFTGLSTLVAEELDADWSQMRAASAPANAELYKNFAFGMQGTGGSTAIANSYMQMRKAGATARVMLVQAAAEQWSVPVGEISVDKGRISHAGSDKSAGFGEFAEAAAKLDPPEDVALKKAGDFRLIGTDVPKLDTNIKTNGEALFTQDLHHDDMLTVVVAHPPQFGATMKSVDASAAKSTPGVVDVQPIPTGIAVYAQDTWSALQGRRALKVSWDTARAETRSTREITDAYRQRAQQPGRKAASRGKPEQGGDGLAKTLTAEYSFPYLAHAPMETLDCVIHAKDGAVESWFGSQLQTGDQGTMAEILGVKPAQVSIHTMYAGGSFGRRAQPGSPFAAEAAHVAKAHAKSRPLKLVWTREDDIQGGWYRPLNVHRLSGGVDADGNVALWDQTIVGQSIFSGSAFAAMIKDGIDPSSVEGAEDLPYGIPNFRVTLHDGEAGVPILWWRSVGHTHTAYSTETFVDELLEMAGKGPVEGRLALLGEHPRHAGVLKAVADLAGGLDASESGRARGVAVHKSFGSYVAQIAEVSQNEDRTPKVHKVWCAVDCGVAVNPNVIRAQMEGGIGFGLGAALYNEITLEEGGRVAQANFDRYRSLRIHEMPDVEVTIVTSDEDPTGVGEPGVPPIAPALANAWRRLTGDAIRDLPFVKIS